MANSEMTTAVSQALTLMAITLANAPQISPQLVNIWATVLEKAGLTPADVIRGAEIIISRERFFPQPAVLIDAVRPPVDAKLQGEAAWHGVLTCVRTFGSYASLTAADLEGDTAALWALDQMGWERLCEDMDDTNRHFKGREFAQLYELARNDRRSAAYIVGRSERWARLRGDGAELTPALCGRPDWSELPAARQSLAERATGDLSGIQMPALPPVEEAAR